MKPRRMDTLWIAIAGTLALAWSSAGAAPPQAAKPDDVSAVGQQGATTSSAKKTAATPASAKSPLAATTLVGAANAAAAAVEHGEIDFRPDANEATAVPEPFRLQAQKFPFELTPQGVLSDDVSVSKLTFPSPVHTDHEANNTVHCEYFRPLKTGRYPACIVLHILGGDFPLSRTFAYALAHRGVAALFVIMPYYGPRQDPHSPVRMVSSDPRQTVAGMTQAVKDIRVATAWLAERPEVDSRQLGIFGISLGGITAALAGEVEPRFAKICPVLAGGGVGSILWDSREPHVLAARQKWEAAGESRQSLQDLLAQIDPATYANLGRNRKILMLNALHDELIPRKCTELLWEDWGKPKIIWYDSGHYSAGWHLLDAIEQVTDFFQPENSQAGSSQAGSSQAGSSQAGSSQAGSSQPGSSQPGATQQGKSAQGSSQRSGGK